MGADRLPILESLGYRAEEMEALASAGAFGPPAAATG
jgi:hypothetical protein